MEKKSFQGIERVLDRSRVMVAGHRGMKALYPENTLLGFRKALEQGVDMLEIDLNLTSDHEVVVMHDNDVSRTTDQSGLIRNMTLAQIKTLDAGGKFAEEFKGLEVPTLSELCELLKDWPEILLNVEIKERTHETVDCAMKILEQYAMLERCVFTCFDAEIIDYMVDTYQVKTQGFPKEYMDNFREGPDGTYSKLFAVGIAMEAFPDRPDMRLLSPELTKEFQDMGIEVWGFCPDDEQTAEEALSSGSTLFTCNNPIPALAVLKKKGLHE
ncbi:glycerophosphodiester phosphodiesterase family protein [Massiliimalia massiliensis]|uniref:glycerophosphodiester phosphodiesterase family protein n=1 Tax=Massiliimalia massiliensis TaxID=1852384 RepID=UPI000984DFD6|nr:glycerophosphodiester phosphodiesterase family protein [Massiliimalia massiliensis]